MIQISERVQEELNEAISHLRNALSFASRSEKASTIGRISSILQYLEDIPLYDQQVDAQQRLQEKLMKMMNGEQPPAF